MPIHKRGGQIIKDYKLWVIYSIQQSNGWYSGECQLYLFCSVGDVWGGDSICFRWDSHQQQFKVIQNDQELW